MNHFKQHLVNQLRFIERSCNAFDDGDESEAHGGAHVDANLNPEYKAIKSGESLAMTYLPAAGKSFRMPLESHIGMTLRQIGFEFLNSPELIALQHPLTI